MSDGRRTDAGVWRYIALVVLAALVLSVSSVVAKSPRIRPDVVAPMIAFAALELELIPGLIVASGIGYLSDVFSGEPRGLHWSSTVIVFLLLRLFVFRLAGSRPLMVTAVVALTTVLGLVARVATQAVLGTGAPSLEAMSPGFLMLALGTLVLGYPIYMLLSTVDKRLRPKVDQFFSST